MKHPWELCLFVVRSLRASLRGELMTHVLTLSTITVSLALAGAVYVAQDNLAALAERWAAERAVVVFVDPALDASSRAALAEQVQNRGLASLQWRSPETAADELAQVLGVASGEALYEVTPWLLEAQRPAPPKADAGGAETDPDVDLAQIAQLDGVVHVDAGTVTAERIRTWSGRLQRLGLGLAVLMVLAAFLVVSNTVGLALNARRDEVEIMDLVGTPLSWIYAAYLVEGVVLGALGAGLAVLLITLPLSGLVDDALTAAGLGQTAGIGADVAVAMLLLGASIGAFGSWIAIRRHIPSLRV